MYHRFAEVESEHWWFQGRRRVVTQLLRDYLPDVPGPAAESSASGLRILDVGSGTGEMVAMLRQFGTVTAVDGSREAVEYCRTRHPVGVSVRHGRIPDDIDETEQYDVVTAFDVVEHLEDDVSALRAFRSVLSPGGHLVLTVPANRLLWSQHDVHSGHHRRYTRAKLSSALQQAGGFQADRIAYFNSVLFLPALAVRAADRLRQRLAPRPQEHADPHLRVPSPRINQALLKVFASEAGLLRRLEPPFGVSLVALCRAI